MPVTYTCLIVDDEPLAQELIAEHVSKIPELIVVERCHNALEASSILTKKNVDLLFLDINMPVIKGIDFFKGLVNRPQVIFTTAHREYALEGFEVSALDYLLKPIVFERFFVAVQKFLTVMEKTANVPNNKVTLEDNRAKEIIFVNQGHRKLKVELNKVKYVESYKDYIKIHSTHGDMRVKENIGAFQKRVGGKFLRIHRSYLVNLAYLTGYSKLDVELNERELPIGSSYREKVLAFLEKAYFSH